MAGGSAPSPPLGTPAQDDDIVPVRNSHARDLLIAGHIDVCLPLSYCMPRGRRRGVLQSSAMWPSRLPRHQLVSCWKRANRLPASEAWDTNWRKHTTHTTNVFRRSKIRRHHFKKKKKIRCHGTKTVKIRESQQICCTCTWFFLQESCDELHECGWFHLSGPCAITYFCSISQNIHATGTR
jgi:hypothetical protein